MEEQICACINIQFILHIRSFRNILVTVCARVIHNTLPSLRTVMHDYCYTYVNRESTLSIVHMYMTRIPTGFLRFYFQSTQLFQFFFGTRDVGLTNPLLGNVRACLHGGDRPKVSEVTRGGSPYL